MRITGQREEVGINDVIFLQSKIEDLEDANKLGSSNLPAFSACFLNDTSHRDGKFPQKGSMLII